MPVPYCQHCLTMTHVDDGACGNCGRPRPGDGWSFSRRNRYVWLGETIDERYQLVQYIGFGSTGEVYRAVSRRTGRSFAAKIIDRSSLPRHVDFEELSERLSREVAVLGAIRSPHVVSAIDFLRTDDDLYVIVMDLAMGTTLERLIFEQQRLPVARAIDILEQLLEALGEVHDRGIVHRDLKPENIVVRTLRSGRPFIHLLDFGVAKLRDDPGLTQGFIGTPLFSAPEQIQSAEKVDHRADLYAVGCILFNMLAGAPPFSADRGTEVMRMHLLSPIPDMPMSTGSSTLDEALAGFFQRALAKTPEERFAHVGEMLSSPIFELASGYRWLSEPPASSEGERDASPPKGLSDRVEGVLDDEMMSATSVTTRVGDPLLVAVNSSGELGAVVFSSGILRIWDSFSDGILTERTVELGAAQPVQLQFGPADQGLRLVLDNGHVHIFEARTLEPMAHLRFPGERVLWVNSAVKTPRDLLVLTTDTLVLLDEKRREKHRLPVGDVLARTPVAVKLPTGWVLFFDDRQDSLRIEEYEGTLHVRWEYDHFSNRDDAQLLDARDERSLLLCIEDRFVEYDREGRQLRTLVKLSGLGWRAGCWLHRTDSLVALNEEGELYYGEAGGGTQRLAEGICAIVMTEDRLRLLSVDKNGDLMLWYPGSGARHLPSSASSVQGGVRVGRLHAPVPAGNTSVQGTAGGLDEDRYTPAPPVLPGSPVGGAEGAVVAVEAGEERLPRVNVTLWAQARSGKRLAALVGGRTGALWLYEGEAWRRAPVSLTAPACLMAWDSKGDALGVLDEEGRLTVLYEQNSVTLPLTLKARPTALALFDEGKGASIALEDQTLVTVTRPKPLADTASVLWRRRSEGPVAILYASRKAGVLLVGRRDGSTQLLDIESGSFRSQVPPTLPDLVDYSISADGHMFAQLRAEGAVEVYDTHAGRLTFRQRVSEEAWQSVWLEPDGRIYLCRVDSDGDFHMVEAAGNAVEVVVSPPPETP